MKKKSKNTWGNVGMRALSFALVLTLVVTLVPTIAFGTGQSQANDSGSQPATQTGVPSTDIGESTDTSNEETTGNDEQLNLDSSSEESSAQAATDATASSESASSEVVLLEGDEPDVAKPSLDVSLVSPAPDVANGGVKTYQSGQSTGNGQAIITASGLPTYAIIVPIPDPNFAGTKTDVRAGVGLYVDRQYAENGLDFWYKDEFARLKHIDIPHAVVVWGTTTTSYQPTISFDLGYPNGTTPNNTELPLSIIALPATGFEAGQQSGGQFIGSGTQASPYEGADSQSDPEGSNATTPWPLTLKWTAQDDFTLSKTFVSAINGTAPTAGTQNFEALINRSYTNVELAKNNAASAENKYTVTYRLSLATNGVTGGSDTGRYYQEYLTIKDDITGLAPGVAPSIIVSEGLGGAPLSGVALDETALAQGTLSVSFNVPGVTSDKPVVVRDFYLQFTFSKNDYTKFAAENNPLFNSETPLEVGNSASVTYKPVIAGSEITSPSSSVDINLGWRQQEPTRPTLTIRKKITVSPEKIPGTATGYQGTRDYTTELANIYEEASYVDGAASKVKFELYQSNDDGVTALPGTTRELPLLLNHDERNPGGAASYSTANFGELLPGTYYIKETTGVSAGVPAETTLHWITVGAPNPSTGISSVTVDGESFAGTDAEIIFDNEASAVGRVMVSVFKQEKYQVDPLTGNPVYGEFVGAVVQLKDSSGTVVQTRTADANGNVYFENVPEGATFSLADGGSPDVNTPSGWVLDTRTNTPSEGIGSTLSGIEANSDNLTTGTAELSDGTFKSDYVLRYIANSGSFETGKYFVGPGGIRVPEMETSNHYANFAAYYAEEITDEAGVVHHVGELAGRFTLYGTQSSLSAIQADLPPGTFYLVEESLYIGGDTNENVNGNPLYDRSNDYQLINADVPASPSLAEVVAARSVAQVVIERGAYGAHATGTAIGSTPLVDEFYLRNVSKLGIMGIRVYDFLPMGNNITTAYGGVYLIEAVDASGNVIPENSPGYYCEQKTVLSTQGYINFTVPVGRYRVSLDPSQINGAATIAALGNEAAAAMSAAEQTTEYAYVNVAANTPYVDKGTVSYDEEIPEITINYNGNGASAEMAYFVSARTPKAEMFKLRGDNNRGMAGAELTLYMLNEEGTAYELLPSKATSTSTNGKYNASNVKNVTFGRSYEAGAGNLSAGTYVVVESFIPKDYSAPDWSKVFYESDDQETLGGKAGTNVVTQGGITGSLKNLRPSIPVGEIDTISCPKFEVSLNDMRSLSAPETGTNLPVSVPFVETEEDSSEKRNTIINTPLVNLRVKAVEAVNTATGRYTASATSSTARRNAGDYTTGTYLNGLPIAGASYELYQKTGDSWTLLGASQTTAAHASYAYDYYAPNESASHASSYRYFTNFYPAGTTNFSQDSAIKLTPGEYEIRQIANPSGTPTAAAGSGTSTHYVNMKPSYAFNVNEKAEISSGGFAYSQNANLADEDGVLNNAGSAKNKYYAINNNTANLDTLYVAFSYLAAPTHDIQKRGETVDFQAGTDQARITVPKNGAEFNLYAVPRGEDINNPANRTYYALNTNGVVIASSTPTSASTPQVISGSTTNGVTATAADSAGYICIRNFDANLPNAYEFDWYLEEIKAPAYTPTDSPNDDAIEYAINGDNPISIKFLKGNYSSTVNNARVGVQTNSNHHGTREMIYGVYQDVNDYGKQTNYSANNTAQNSNTYEVDQDESRDACYVFMNILEEYWIHVVKVPLVPGVNGEAANPSTAGQYTLDLKAGSDENPGENNWVQIAVYGACFNIYKLEEGETYPGENGGIPNLVDTITTGLVDTTTTDDHDEDILRNDAKTKALPPGTYWVQEVSKGLNYGNIDDYLNAPAILNDGSPGAYQSWEGTNTVYVQDEPNLTYDKDRPQDDYAPEDPFLDEDEWEEAQNSGTFTNGWPVTIAPIDYENNPDPTDEEKTKELAFGNTNRLDANRGARTDTFVQLHGAKLGYQYEPNQTLSWERNPLANVEFKVWPAYRRAGGDYYKLRTWDNEPLATIRTDGNGVFDTSQINMSAAYRQYGRTQGATADSWTYQKPDDGFKGAVNWNYYTNTSTGYYDGYSWTGDEFVQDVSMRGHIDGGWCLIFEETKDSLPEAYKDDPLQPASKIAGNLGSTNQSFYWRWTEPKITSNGATQCRGGIFVDPNNAGGSPYYPQQEYRMEWENHPYAITDTNFDQVPSIPALARDEASTVSNLKPHNDSYFSNYWILPNYVGSAQLQISKENLTDELLPDPKAPDAETGPYTAATNNTTGVKEGDGINGAYYYVYQVQKSALEAADVSTGEYNAGQQEENINKLKTYFTLTTLSTKLNPDERPGAADPDATDLRLVTSGAADQIGTTIKNLHPGYYFIVEDEAPLNYNEFGAWFIDANVNKGGAEGNNTNGGLGSDSNNPVDFGWKEAPGFIGPIELRGNDDYRGNNSTYNLEVSNKIKPRLSIRNFWNTLPSEDSTYTATYELYTGADIDIATDEPIETKTISGTNTVTFDYSIGNTTLYSKDGTLGFPDGVYTIVETGISAVTQSDYTPNPAAYQSNYLVITVEDGEITRISKGTDEVSYYSSHDEDPNNQTTDFGELSLRFDRSTNTLDVNQPSQGALIIQVGLIDAQRHQITGESSDLFTGWYNVPSDSTTWQYGKGFWSETFELQVDDGTGSFVAPNDVFETEQLESFGLTGERAAGTLTWNASPDANSNGMRQKLPPNQLYRIRATSSEQYDGPGKTNPVTKWTLDLNNTQDWFYFTVTEYGVVYLTNNAFVTGGTSAASPVQGNIAASQAYFFNESTSGTYALYKTDSTETGNTINIGGKEYSGEINIAVVDTAVFELYRSEGEGSTTPTGELVATIQWNQTAYPSFNSQGNNPIDTTTGYQFTVPAGDYVVREIAAPLENNLAVRTNEYFPLHVEPANGPDYKGYGAEGSTNALGIYDPAITYLNASKEVIYPQVEGSGGAERRLRVSSFPLSLLRLQDQYYDPADPEGSAATAQAAKDITMWDDWDMIRTSSVDDPTNGLVKDISRFRITRSGVYMLVEREQYTPEAYGYIKSNDKYTYDRDDEDGTTNVFPSCEPIVVYFDEASGELKIQTDEAEDFATGVSGTPAMGGTNILGYDNLTTITNPFDGYVIAAQKLDYMSESALDPYPGTTNDSLTTTRFALYDADVYSKEDALDDNPDSAGSIVYQIEVPRPEDPSQTTNIKQIKQTTPGSNATVYFDPLYFPDTVELPRKFWIRELAAPTGKPVDSHTYVLDDWYDTSIKEVTVGLTDEQGERIDLTTEIFKDGLPNNYNLDLSKGIATANGIAASATEDAPLSAGPLTETYVITPGGIDSAGNTTIGINNGLPLFNYNVYDPGFTFLDTDDAEISVGTDGAQGTELGYSITTVRLGASYAYASAAAQKTNTPTPVYASVNGSGWQLLNQEREFTLDSAVGASTFTEDQEIRVRYSMVAPGPSATDPYGEPVTENNYYVGSYFKPGTVEMDASFASFKPTRSQAEIGKIQNVATVSATGVVASAEGNGSSSEDLSDDSNGAEVAFTIAQRPSMDVEKVLASYYDTSEDTTHDEDYLNTHAAESGDQLTYTITLTNARDDDELGIKAPVILDWLEESAVNYLPGSAEISLKRVGEIAYTSYDDEVVFTQNGSLLKWVFPSDEVLELGDSIKLELTVEIGDIVPRGFVRNEAYGTSELALEYSTNYPAGASFVAADGMSSAQAVWAENTNVEDDWTKMVGAGQGDYGLLVKAATSEISVTASADPKITKSVAVNDGSYLADVPYANRNDTNVGAYLGDTIHFSLQHMSGQYKETNIRLVDVLPYVDDQFFTGGSRGTTASQDLLDYLEFDPSSLEVYAVVDGAPVEVTGVTLNLKDERNITTLYNGGGTDTPVANAAHPQALVIDLGDFQLGATDSSGATLPQLLTVEFSMKLRDDLTQEQKNAVFNANANVLISNNMAIGYTILAGGGTIDMLQPAERARAAYVKFIADEISISGKIWEDKDEDGRSTGSVYQDADIPRAGVAVNLYKYVGEGANVPDMSQIDPDDSNSWPAGLTRVGSATSGADGTYTFANLESSYDSTSSPAHSQIHYLVGYALPSGYYWTTPQVNGSTVGDAGDSDATYTNNNDARGFTPWFTASNNVANVDAGVFTKASIKGRVWQDDNANGLQDAGEGVVPGGSVTVELYVKSADDSYSKAATTVTNASTGAYEFTDVNIPYGPETTYRVVVDKNTVAHDNYTYEWTATKVTTGGSGATVYAEADSDVTPLASSPSSAYEASDRTLRYAGVELTPTYGSTTSFTDAGIVPIGRVIKGRAFEDKNQDGLQSNQIDPAADDYEGGIDGVMVFLYEGGRGEGNLIDQTATDADGRYTFGLGAAGDTVNNVGPLDGTKTYYVAFARPNTTDWAYSPKGAGSNDTINSDVYPSGDEIGYTDGITSPNYSTDAGMYRLTTVSGVVWNDNDGDGMKNDSLNFDFTAGGAGTLPVSYVVTLQASDSDALGGWIDVASQTINSGDGFYSFSSVAPGSYRVRFDRSNIQSYTEGYEWTKENHTTPGSYTDNKVTGDASGGLTGKASLIGVTATINVVYLDYAPDSSTNKNGYTGIDAGIHPLPNTFNGKVWNDYNHNGLQDTDEPGIDNVEVTLMISEDGNTWEVRDIATTLADGSYGFGLDWGGLDFSPNSEYKVAFNRPGSSWKWTEPNQGLDDTLDSDALYVDPRDDGAATASIVFTRINSGPLYNFDAGLYEPSTISGGLDPDSNPDPDPDPNDPNKSGGLAGIWRDANDDGIQQWGETQKPLPLGTEDDGIYVTVRLYQSHDANGDELVDDSEQPQPRLIDTIIVDTPEQANYAFEDLEKGGYYIEIDRSNLTNMGEDYQWALTDQGSDPALASRFTPYSDVTGSFDTTADGRLLTVARSELIELGYGATNSATDGAVGDPYNTGIAPYVHIEGFTWNDANGNGVRDAAELARGGVPVNLYRNGSLFATATTAEDGSYRFDRQMVDQEYKVAFSNPDYTTLRWTQAGADHTATDLRGPHAENIYYFDEAHTIAAVISAHEDSWNAGLQSIPSYSVTYYPNGGTVNGTTEPFGPIIVQAGSLVPYYDATLANNSFNGWFEDDITWWDFANRVMPERDVDLVAQWTTDPTYNVYYDANGGTGTQFDATAYYAGTTVALLGQGDVTRAGYAFLGWSLTQDGPALDGFVITADTTVYAIWEVVPTTAIADGEVPSADILDQEVPLAAIGYSAWALLNLILTIIGVVLSVLLVVFYLRKRRKEEDEDEAEERRLRIIAAQARGDEKYQEDPETSKKRLIWRIIAVGLAVIAIILFILTEDMTLPMVFIDQWTIFHVIIMVLQIICCIIASRRKKLDDEDTEEEMEAAQQAYAQGVAGNR